MSEKIVLTYAISDPIELNLSYIPFVNDGGLFIPTPEVYPLGETITLNLQLPGKKEVIAIEGKVIWVTPPNALHHVLAGIGIKFTGSNTQATRKLIESQLDKSVEIGGYCYGIMQDSKQDKK